MNKYAHVLTEQQINTKKTMIHDGTTKKLKKTVEERRNGTNVHNIHAHSYTERDDESWYSEYRTHRTAFQ